MDAQSQCFGYLIVPSPFLSALYLLILLGELGGRETEREGKMRIRGLWEDR